MDTLASTDFKTRADLAHALDVTMANAHKFFEGLNQEQLMDKPTPERWSAAENLQHLIKSTKPVVLGLRLPKPITGLLFGKQKGGSTDYETVKANYVAQLDKGFKSPARYEPKRIDHSGDRDKLLRDFNTIRHQLLDALDNWTERQLDTVRFPHPSLGKITAREMLYFTIFHTRIHVDIVKQHLGIQV